MRVLIARLAAVFVALAVSVGALAGTAAPAAATGSAATAGSAAAGCDRSFDTYARIGVGSKGAQAAAVECLLHEAGYATTQNASFSSYDAGKLKKFQRKHHMKRTGHTNAAAWAALIAQGSRPKLAQGATGAAVSRLRLTLRALGHEEMTSSSTYDAPTVAAVKSLQRKLHLKRTGKVSTSFWKILQNGGRKLPVAKKSSSSKGAKALAFAKKQLGERYKYGAAGPNRWDCSGLTMKAWAAAGKKLPHSAAGQFKKGKHVKKSQLRKGDLVFFYSGPSHVGIYAGGGKVIHAPRPGSKVSYIKIKYMPWKGARRPA